MTRRHILAIARKEWLHITRDPMTVFLMGIGPVLMLVLISYAMATDVKNIPVVVFDQDQSEQSIALVDQLDQNSVLSVTAQAYSLDDVSSMIERRDARVAVIIERGLGEQYSNVPGIVSIFAEGPAFRFVVDGTEPISAETSIEAALKESVDFTTKQVQEVLDSADRANTVPGQEQLLRSLIENPINLSVENKYNPDLKSLWDLVPAMIAVMLSLPGMSISTVIARERSQGTLEALVATPINKHAILLGKALPYAALGMANVVLMYVVARALFGLPFRGNLLLFLAVSAVYVFATLAIGMLFSILIPSIEAALWASMLFFLFPGMLLSGMFFPVDIFPLALKIGSLEVPATNGVLINRGMFLQGTDLTVLWWNVLILLVLAVEGFEIAGRLFKKRIG